MRKLAVKVPRAGTASMGKTHGKGKHEGAVGGEWAGAELSAHNQQRVYTSVWGRVGAGEQVRLADTKGALKEAVGQRAGGWV